MRILHVVRGMANVSGPTHIVVALSEHQAALGHRVHVWYVERPGQESVLPEEPVRCREFPLSLPFMNPGISFPFRRAVQMHLHRFDVIHIHAIWNFATLNALQASRRAGVPSLVAPQGSLEPWALQYRAWKKSWYTKGIELPEIRKAAGMQALTLAEKNQIRQNGIQTPAFVIPNGINTAEFDCLPAAADFRKRHKIRESQPTILFMGRVHPKKGLDQAARIMKRVAAEIPDAILVVAGGDGGSGYLERARGFFREAGVMQNVRFVGEMRGRDKLIALSAADLFLLASYSEGLPMAILEALAAGRPPIVSQHCNVPEIQEEDAGRSLPLDADAFAKEIITLLRDQNRRARFSANAQRLAREKFEWRSVAEQTVCAYRELRKIERKQ